MGATQSRQSKDIDEKIIYSNTPVELSQDVVNHLADSTNVSNVSPDRQMSLDVHVRSRIQSEITRLRQEEENIKKEIELAMGKENIDRQQLISQGDSSSALVNGFDEGGAKTQSSIALIGDLEDIQRKVEKFKGKRNAASTLWVDRSRDSLLTCYKNHSRKPLECSKEVSDFKGTVTKLEQV